MSFFEFRISLCPRLRYISTSLFSYFQRCRTRAASGCGTPYVPLGFDDMIV